MRLFYLFGLGDRKETLVKVLKVSDYKVKIHPNPFLEAGILPPETHERKGLMHPPGLQQGFSFVLLKRKKTQTSPQSCHQGSSQNH